ncbi:MAG: undecaprenyldiphospho-muramoylpentapeptide beta-N-acetylglucosaminyltransferase [Bacteroidales bacterium]|nr:undecaprenyldiphospho-muramoylpentapeptide beta-N-acetylglucosaminyltransferase [Bacteroidales bacterium]
MQQPDSIKVILSGGGTGGHIFPAIAIANAIRNQVPNAEFLFVGAKGRMEMEKVPAAGFKIEGLWISGLQRRLTLDNLSFPFKVISSLIKARSIIRSFEPDIVIGTGGYASGPTLNAAASMGIPTLIQEQNSYPGITNKMLASKVQLICVAYEGMEKFFPASKIRITGNPIRQDITRNNLTKSEALSYFGLQEGPITLLVVGGSLGARTINQSIHSGLNLLAEQNIQLIWQTGKSYAEIAATSVSPYKGKGLMTTAFISRMDMAYAAADIVISRSGAIAISELCAIGKPCILVPSPNVTEDHQTKNTLALTAKNAAIMVKDKDAGQTLVKEVIKLSADKVLQDSLRKNILGLAHPDAAETIAKHALSLLKIKN